ncbi:MAG: adenylate/guanylate cyclase domain-containing protein [Isosphaeraceae bacterium]
MLWILVSSKTSRDRFFHDRGPLEFGRGPQRGAARKEIPDPKVSKDQLVVEEEASDRVRLRNLSTHVAVRLADGSSLEPAGELSARLPVRLHVGDTLIEIEPAPSGVTGADVALLRTIEPPVAVGSAIRAAAPRLGTDPVAEEMARWFESLIGVQRAAASSPDFFTQTARAVVELIGLDSGLVLLRKDGVWGPVACYPSHSDPASQYSRSIVETVTRQRRTFYQEIPATAASLEGVVAVVASPILNEAQQVIGAVYGARRGEGRSPEIRPLEAQLTQVLAAAVAAGLARQESEAHAARRRVQFEQFFTPDLAAALDRDRSLLEGREREVTVLFADIRGFSSVSERLSARLTCELIREIMEHLTAKVMESAGVVVDYIGDGLLAMWNAPVDQPDHAVRACRAALAMREGLPDLNRRWEGRLGRAFGLGIGVNSGTALVGNTGSHKKFKYGPLGHSVNLASRIEGATKHLGVGLLISGSTRDLVGEAFATRRLCRARLLGIAHEVNLFELHAESASADWQSRCESYEQALDFYESGKWSDACRTLFPLLAANQETYDLPTLSLLGRAVECLKAPPPKFDPVLELKSK